MECGEHGPGLTSEAHRRESGPPPSADRAGRGLLPHLGVAKGITARGRTPLDRSKALLRGLAYRLPCRRV